MDVAECIPDVVRTDSGTSSRSEPSSVSSTSGQITYACRPASTASRMAP